MGLMLLQGVTARVAIGIVLCACLYLSCSFSLGQKGTSGLKNCPDCSGVSAIPESASGELQALDSGTLSKAGEEAGPEFADLGTQTSTGLAQSE